MKPKQTGGPTLTGAIILAGGAGSRLGGIDKPALRVGRRTLLDLALSAVAPVPTVVVGPHRNLPAEVMQTREEPNGGGPAAALAHGLAVLGPSTGLVAILAADLPGISHSVIDALLTAFDGPPPGADGVMALDTAGRPQYLISMWRFSSLEEAVLRRPSWHNGAIRQLLDPMRWSGVAISAAAGDDVDTPDDLAALGDQDPLS